MRLILLITLVLTLGSAGAHGASVYPENVLASADLRALAEKMEKKRPRHTEAGFVRMLFSQMHRQVLKQFKEGTTLAEALQTGAYNCLTASTFFALLLDHFQVSYRIVETNYHIFLLANVGGSTWLIETTDPLNGIVSKPEEVEARIAFYRQMPPPVTGALRGYAYRKDYFRVLSVQELRGLDYFNQAVCALNEGNLKKSVYLLQQASVFYQSGRIREIAGILSLMINEHGFSEKERSDLLRRLFIIEQLSAPALASAAGR